MNSIPKNALSRLLRVISLGLLLAPGAFAVSSAPNSGMALGRGLISAGPTMFAAIETAEADDETLADEEPSAGVSDGGEGPEGEASDDSVDSRDGSKVDKELALPPELAALRAAMVGKKRKKRAPAPRKRLLDGLKDVPQLLNAEKILIEIEVGSDRSSVIEAIQEGRAYLLPLEELADLASIELSLPQGETESSFLIASTPLGSVEFDGHDLVEFENDLFLRQDSIEEKLVSTITYDSRNLSLGIDVPWQIASDELPPLDPRDIEADATPPSAALSTVTLHATTDWDQKTGNSSIMSTAELAGRVADGWWSTRLQIGSEGEPRPSDYVWIRPLSEKRRLLVGHQRQNGGSLVNGLELTGAQFAYTNRPNELFERSGDQRQLLSRRLQPRTVLEGEGPPAGLAELRLDGRVIARQVIRLDGTYQFYDVFLPVRQLIDIEVYLYERNNLAVPVEIVDHTRSASDILLPGGAFVHQGAFGLHGNLAYNNGSGNTVGFYQWRHGLTESVTVEASAAQGPNNRQYTAGFAAALPAGFTLSAAGATSDNGANAWDAGLQRMGRRWRLRTYSRIEDAGYRAPTSSAFTDHSLDLTWVRKRFQLSMIGRVLENERDNVEYLLPSLAWVPNSRVALRARPDRLGDYRYDFSYRYSRTSRLGVSYQVEGENAGLGVDLTQRVSRNSYLTLASRQANLESRKDSYSATLNWSTGGRYQPTWQAGVVRTGDQLGYRASVIGQVAPGLYAQFQLAENVDDGYSTSFGEGLRATAGISADLAVSGRRLVPIYSSLVGRERGGIAGRIAVHSDGQDDNPRPGRGRYNLAGVMIYLDGSPAAVTNQGGEYFIGNLRPGLFRVELDPENLPIELNPDWRTYHVKVESAAVTRLDLSVFPEFGFAGRVTDAEGLPIQDILLEVIDKTGNVLDSSFSDQFGLYRFDGLPPGLYRLRVAPAFAERYRMPQTARTIQLDDTFIFDQNLQIDTLVHPRQQRRIAESDGDAMPEHPEIGVRAVPEMVVADRGSVVEPAQLTALMHQLVRLAAH